MQTCAWVQASIIIWLHKVSIVHIWLRKVCKGNVILVREHRTCHEGHSSIWIRHDLIGEKHRNVELCGELGDAAQPVEIMCFSCMSWYFLAQACRNLLVPYIYFILLVRASVENTVWCGMIWPSRSHGLTEEHGKMKNSKKIIARLVWMQDT